MAWIWSSKQDAAGIQRSEAAIAALVDREVARGIPYERIVLAGFSQGCAMALHTALRLPHPIAGVMALSGYLPLADRFATERHAANANTPIFMAHGTQDPVVILKRGEDFARCAGVPGPQGAVAHLPHAAQRAPARSG